MSPMALFDASIEASRLAKEHLAAAAAVMLIRCARCRFLRVPRPVATHGYKICAECSRELWHGWDDQTEPGA
jgi:hypothetical protein